MQRPLQAGAKARGLVLLEALVAASVLAVLAALAAPSFAALSERMKLRSGVQALTSSLYAARAEAIKRGGHVTLACGSGHDCGGNKQWRCGWIVFADANENGTLDPADDELLHTGQAPPASTCSRPAAAPPSSSMPGASLAAWARSASSCAQAPIPA